MPQGVSPLYYPDQAAVPCPLVVDDSYVLVRLHSAQAFFPAGLLVRPAYLVVSSSVTSTFQPGAPTQSLHQIATIQKNTPSHLGLSINLTSWLPARAADTLTVTLKFSVIRDNPFQKLTNQIGQLGLAATVSLIRPEWAVAVKITQVAGEFLSIILQEGQEEAVFVMEMDLNLVAIRAGYYAVIGSLKEEPWPEAGHLRIDANGQLNAKYVGALSTLSYAVLQVLALKRRSPEVQAHEPWGELLQQGKEQIMDAPPSTDGERVSALRDWRTTLAQVRALARKEPSFLRNEVVEAIAEAQLAVEQQLQPTAREAAGGGDYPGEWQEVLDLRTPQALRRRVQGYRAALAESQRVLTSYGLADN